MEYNKYLQIFENPLNGRDRTRTSEDGTSGSVKEIIPKYHMSKYLCLRN